MPQPRKVRAQINVNNEQEVDFIWSPENGIEFKGDFPDEVSFLVIDGFLAVILTQSFLEATFIGLRSIFLLERDLDGLVSLAAVEFRRFQPKRV